MKEYPEENGSMTLIDVDGTHRIEWTIRRSRGESIFGIKGSRIFELKIKKDGKETAVYERGWIQRPHKDDEATELCVNHILQSYGKEKKKKRKD